MKNYNVIEFFLLLFFLSKYSKNLVCLQSAKKIDFDHFSPGLLLLWKKRYLEVFTILTDTSFNGLYRSHSSFIVFSNKDIQLFWHNMFKETLFFITQHIAWKSIGYICVTLCLDSILFHKAISYCQYHTNPGISCFLPTSVEL